MARKKLTKSNTKKSTIKSLPKNLTTLAGGLQLREQVSQGGRVLRSLAVGTKLKLLSRPSADWVEVETLDQPALKGFVPSRFVEEVKKEKHGKQRIKHN